MPPRKNSNIESITEEYIDGAVKVHVKASEVPPRQNLNISFKDADMLGDEVTLSNQEAYEESHGKIYEMTHNNTVPWRNWAFYLILLSMLTVCFTFAKYASFASGDAQAAVAKFEIKVNGSISANDIDVTVGGTNITDIADLGDTNTINVIFDEDHDGPQTITFTVTNNSEVTVHITSDTSWIETSDTVNHTETLGTIDTGNIAPGEHKDVVLTINKAASSGTATGTLTIVVDQVD